MLTGYIVYVNREGPNYLQSCSLIGACAVYIYILQYGDCSKISTVQSSFHKENYTQNSHSFREVTIKIVFLFLNENICCGHSLEEPQLGASKVYPQHRFSWNNKKNNVCFGRKSALSGSIVLTPTRLWADSADDKLEILFMFFLENRI